MTGAPPRHCRRSGPGQGGRMISHFGPLARPSFRSRVANGSRAPPPARRTTHRSWSGWRATPIRARRRGRKGTTSRRVAASPGESWWLPGEKSGRLFRVGARCWSPRAGPVPGRSLNLRRARTQPNCLRRRSRPAPRPPETHRRLPSRPVFVTGIENARRSDASLRCLLAAAHITQPRVDGGLRGDSLQLTTKELLHGLALERCAHRQFVANCLRHSPDGDLYGHAVILKAGTAIGKQAMSLQFSVASSMWPARECGRIGLAERNPVPD